MGYKFEFLPGAEKQLRALDVLIAKRIIRKLEWIEKQTNPIRHATVLRDAKIGDIRFRIGDYRVVAVIDHEAMRIVIAAVGHRREIYL
jgi:mRNA interferase RelE/StbE